MEVRNQYEEIILGSSLGDGSLKLHKPYKNARFSFRHSSLQKEYFMWKVKELEEISSEKCFWKQPSGGWGDKEKLRYQSLALESLTKLYHSIHKEGKFYICQKWLNRLTPLSLAVWWMDDGSIVANGRKGVFCTDGFKHKDQLALSRYLRERWGVNTGIGIKRGVGGKEYYRLYFYSSEQLKRFLRIILPYIPTASMLSKILLLYKDSNLQQRWISEVCQLTSFPLSIIEKYLAEKKQKWKHFRK